MKPWFRAALVLLALLPLRSLASLGEDVREAIENFRRTDASLETFFKSSVGYVVFPNVGKGGFIIGAAHGSGLVYEKGHLVGEASLAQGTFGAQIGGQEFSELVFFQTPAALGDFKRGKFTLSANVSAVAAADGAARSAKYRHGVAVFVLPKAGLMLEASVGGQNFTFKARSK